MGRMEVRGITNNSDVVALGLAMGPVTCVTEQIELRYAPYLRYRLGGKSRRLPQVGQQ